MQKSMSLKYERVGVTVEDSEDEFGALGRQLGDQIRVVVEQLLPPCPPEKRTSLLATYWSESTLSSR